jgi:hypothetical protein
MFDYRIEKIFTDVKNNCSFWTPIQKTDSILPETQIGWRGPIITEQVFEQNFDEITNLLKNIEIENEKWLKNE